MREKKKMNKYLLMALIVLGIGAQASNTPVDTKQNPENINNEQNELLNKNKTGGKQHPTAGQDLMDLSLTYEDLSPSAYGSWKSLNMTYYQKYAKGLTFVYQAGLFHRNEGSAAFGALGVYKDWTPSFYTFTQLGGGTDSTYLPKYRLDQEFYYKFGEKKQWVGILGISYIDYYDVHKDTILSAGFMYYGEKYNVTYRHFFNKSDPESVRSGTDLISLGYGEEKDQWIYLDVSYGNQAYQTLLSPSHPIFSEDALDTKLSYRKWTTENSGWFGAIGYFNLHDEYKKYLFQVGYFKEF